MDPPEVMRARKREDPLTNLRSIYQALADLVHTHRHTPANNDRRRCRLGRMIHQLEIEISYRSIPTTRLARCPSAKG